MSPVTPSVPQLQVWTMGLMVMQSTVCQYSVYLSLGEESEFMTIDMRDVSESPQSNLFRQSQTPRVRWAIGDLFYIDEIQLTMSGSRLWTNIRCQTKQEVSKWPRRGQEEFLGILVGWEE